MRVAVATLLMMATGCAADVEPTGSTRSPIVDGTPDTEHDGVVALGSRRVACDAHLVPVCTGVVVAPRVVLSAAHCVQDLRAGQRLEVMAGDSPDDPAVEHAWIRRFEVHPDFVPGSNTADLALFVLDEPLSVPPVELRSDPLDASLVGAQITMVGYGVVDASSEPDGVRRSGTAAVTEVTPDAIRLEPSPAMSCKADSGGPVLDDAGVVVGITSFGDPGCREYGIATRVDPYVASFVQPFLDEVAAEPDPPEPAVAYADACEAPCVSDDECPAGLACLPGPAGARCAVPGTPDATLADACDGSSRCDCVRVAPNDGPEACRCVETCGGTPPPPDEPGGCCSAAGRSPAPPLSMLLALIAGCIFFRRLFKH